MSQIIHTNLGERFYSIRGSFWAWYLRQVTHLKITLFIRANSPVIQYFCLGVAKIAFFHMSNSPVYIYNDSIETEYTLRSNSGCFALYEMLAFSRRSPTRNIPFIHTWSSFLTEEDTRKGFHLQHSQASGCLHCNVYIVPTLPFLPHRDSQH